MSAIGILVMAYGGPNNLEDVEPYLLDIRGGRPTSPELVKEIRERYARIGGRSPLLEITRRQASALQNELNRRYEGEHNFSAYVGMRHWAPRIRDAIRAMVSDGLQHGVALVMAPHYSRMSVQAYMDRLTQAKNELGRDIDFTLIRSWHDHPGLIDAIAEKARGAFERFEKGDPFVLFTAHSLPSRILAEDDPYPGQLNETAHLVANKLGLAEDRWRFCYQSAGRTKEAWLGPEIEEVVLEVARAGEKDLLVVPVGFVADHVEVLYDIDIEARELAREHSARLERSESLNDSPTFIHALADLVSQHLQSSNGSET